MLSFWGRFAVRIGLIACGILLAWPLLGLVPALLLGCIILAALHARGLHNLVVLDTWLRGPDDAPVPEGSGMWEWVFARLRRMVRRQQQTREDLREALARFRKAGDAMPEGVVILDQADRIEWCNPQAENHFGLDKQRDIGQHITYLVRQPQFAEYLRAPHELEAPPLRLAKNQNLVLSVQRIPYGDNQKLVISRDVTRWEKVEVMRRDFVANVSHELRTPLTVVAGFLETLADSPDSATLRSFQRPIELMRDQTRRMQHLVEDLLALSKLESTQNPLQEEEVDLSALIKAVRLDALDLSAGRHRITLDIRSPHRLHGSEYELRSAFGNLVSNAVRYTPEGGEIRISWHIEGDTGVFTVEDTGIGIEPQHIPRLTERFYRVDRGRSRETGGTGLGLAIVKHVLNRHQARLEISSEPGRGSRFAAVFPASRLKNPAPHPAIQQSNA